MFHLIWGIHFTVTFRMLLICCERSEYDQKKYRRTDRVIQ